MFTNFSKYRITTATSGKRTFTKVGGLKETSTVYTTSKDKVVESAVKPQHKAEAFYGSNFNATSYSQGVNFASPTSQQNNYSNFLDGFVNVYDTKMLRLKYKDMYYFDNICGTAVDLRSELPFSDYTLTGITDPSIMSVYEDAMNELKPLQFLRRLMADYFVFGAAAYSMIFDDERGIFLSPRPLDLDRCTFITSPLLNDPPFINYKMDEWLKGFIDAYNNGDERVRRYVERRSGLTKLVAHSEGQEIKLDPDTTLYLERNDLSISPQTQVSYYSRALKYYEYEKRIFRGTLDLAEKRLKSILHITVGNDTILPTSDTLAEISNAFKTANLDPTDAIVATHSYVSTNEVRQPTDFWRWDEISDFTNRGKMIALGINEQFLSGDMSYASMESALSVFLEQLLGDRTYVTDRVFYKTIFPYIAKENGFLSEESKQQVREVVESRDIRLNPLIQEKEVHQKVNYQIPNIQWHKALKPRVDKDWLEVLQTLKDQDIPVPYRMWFTAAGVDIDELLQQYNSDDELDKAIQDYKRKEEDLDAMSGDFDEGNPDEEQGLSEEPTPEGFDESVFESSKQSGINPHLFQGSSIKRLGLRARKSLGDLNSPEVNAMMTPRVRTEKGRTRAMSRREKAVYDDTFNKKLSKRLAEKDKIEQAKDNETFKANSTRKVM